MDNDTDSAAAVSVKNEICELKANGVKGKRLDAVAGDDVQIVAQTNVKSETGITVRDPRLWSLAKPQCYVVVNSIEEGSKVVDQYETPFGIRTIRFDAEKGFFLNGKHVHLNVSVNRTTPMQ